MGLITIIHFIRQKKLLENLNLIIQSYHINSYKDMNKHYSYFHISVSTGPNFLYYISHTV